MTQNRVGIPSSSISMAWARTMSAMVMNGTLRPNGWPVNTRPS